MPSTSARQEGMITSAGPLGKSCFSVRMFTRSRYWYWSTAGMSVPSRAFTRSGSMVMVWGWGT